MAQVSHWCFTSFAIDTLTVPNAHKQFQYCVYQVEACPETGRLHLQGYIEFRRSIRMLVLKKLLNDPGVHLEPRMGTRDQARFYCMDYINKATVELPIEVGTWIPDVSNQGARTDLKVARASILASTSLRRIYADETLDSVTTKYPRWVERVHASRPIDVPIPHLVLYPWQSEMTEILSGPIVQRAVYWIWSAASKTGKSTFLQYCLANYDVLLGRDYANTVRAYDGQSIIWFDLTRAESDADVPYSALELLSNQTYHLSTKYDPIQKYISAHVVVTANCAPNQWMLPERCKTFALD
nr:MAG: replication associated protein [Cressdnaviricota sp.]